MPVAIVATVGSASANSYVTLADANTELEARLNATLWDAATTDTKNRALVEAQRTLQTLEWKGSRVDATQVLAWPRQYVENPDAPFDATASRPFDETLYYAATIIPDRVRQAQVEIAFQFVNAGTTDLAALPATDGVVQETIGPLSTTFASPAQRARGIARFPRVRDLLAPLLANGAGGLTVVRV